MSGRWPTAVLIDGVAAPAADGATFIPIGAVDGQPLPAVAASDAADVAQAVAVARRAVDHGSWSRRAPSERRAALVAAADAIEAHADELAAIVVRETGKALASARAEAGHAAATFRFYGEAIDKLYGEVAPTAPGELALVTRTPVGVVGVVTPWNYPLMMPAWKVAPALAAGCAVVLKPAEQSPVAALRLAEVVHAAGVPVDALSVVPGLGPTAGAALGRHPDVDALGFTGSLEVGRRFLGYAGEAGLKAVSVEAGGKSPHVVFADAPDLDEAADTIAAGIFANAGQMCDAGSRLLVQRDVADALVERILTRLPAWEPGDPRDPTTRVGAIVEQRQLERVAGFVARATGDGARLRAGGEIAEPVPGGRYYRPTVLDRVDPASELFREEVFGPVLAVTTFDDADQAVALANGTPYGLAAAVWTRDLPTAADVASRIEAGSVFVNGYDRAGLSVPFGGHRRSGIGVDRSLHAIEKHTRLKTTWIHWEAR